MVEEGRRALSANPLPCPQSGFRDFRGSKRRAVYWHRECLLGQKAMPKSQRFFQWIETQKRIG